MKSMICRYSIHLTFVTTLLLTTDFVLAGSGKNEPKSSPSFKKPVLTESQKELFKTEFSKLNTEYERLVTLENYKDAIPIQKKMSELTEEIVGPNHPHTATMYLSLSELYLKIEPQEIGEAIASLWKVYKGRQNLLGENHADTISILKQLGNLYFKKGKHLKALSFLKMAYKHHKELLGPEHLETIKTLFLLAKAVEKEHGRTTEDLEKAQTYFKKVLEVQTRELGEEDPSTLATLLQIGRTAVHQQNIQLTLDCSKKVYETRTKLLGEDDPLTSEAKELYASALTSAGRDKETVEIHKKKETDGLLEREEL